MLAFDDPCPSTDLALVHTPYTDFVPVDLNWSPRVMPPRGEAMVWWLRNADRQQQHFRWLYHRPPGIPLFIILPRAGDIAQVASVLNQLSLLQPRGILPSARIVSVSNIAKLLKTPPRNLATSAVDYLTRRGMLPREESRREVSRILELAPYVTSISTLARRMYMSRRTLGRHLEGAGLPVPSHWLQFGRLLHVVSRLQTDDAPIFRIAARFGYPDGFTLSNQMKRLLGLRPSEVRRHFGWEWVTEHWLYEELKRGSICPQLHSRVAESYFRGNHRKHPRAQTTLRS